MKKLFSLLFVILVCATTAFAAPPGQVVKVDAQSITVHWQIQKSGISKHGMASGSYGGGSREFTFKLTPQTTYWQGGKQVTVASIQKGATVKVTATNGVASRVDIL
jgi:predicted S18 family serine protease